MDAGSKMTNKTLELAYFIRLVEQFISMKVKGGEMPMPVHLSIGQETVSVAVCESLNKDEDYIWGSYRSHGIYIARTSDLVGLFAEILGKEGGCSGGRGGSMHIISPKYKILGTSGIVGSHISNAVGFSYGQKMLAKRGITCVIFGDGATDAGTFYDSINIALLRKTPTLFLLENNDLAIRTPSKLRQHETGFSKKVEAFGLRVTETGPRMESMIREIKLARDRILTQGLPEMIKLDTIRWHQHLGSEYELNQSYRDFNNEKEILKNDEINIWLGSMPSSEREDLSNRLKMVINDAWQAVEAMQYPNLSTIYDYAR